MPSPPDRSDSPPFHSNRPESSPKRLTSCLNCFAFNSYHDTPLDDFTTRCKGRHPICINLYTFDIIRPWRSKTWPRRGCFFCPIDPNRVPSAWLRASVASFSTVATIYMAAKIFRLLLFFLKVRAVFFLRPSPLVSSFLYSLDCGALHASPSHLPTPPTLSVFSFYFFEC